MQHRPFPRGLWHRRLAALATSIILALPASAQQVSPSAAAAASAPQGPNAIPEANRLPDVKVQGTVLREDRSLSPTAPVTRVDSRELERHNTSTLNDALGNIPGVTVQGGPRDSATKLSIRGYSDSEDVRVKIDGAVKGFEKYRYGSGISLDPELIKSIEVERGTSLTAGSGALGGTISAATKSAADLLRRGEAWGALAKLGYNDNNHERLRMLSLFGRPHERVDLLVSLTGRESSDLKLADGSRLPLSATDGHSRLFKLGLMPTDDLVIDISRVEQHSGPALELYDVLGGSPTDSFGVVERTVDDLTHSLRFNYAPAALPWFKLRGTLARGDMHLLDLRLMRDNPRRDSDDTYDWRYRIDTAELFGEARYEAGPLQGQLTTGLQRVRNDRDAAVRYSNPLYIDPDMADFPGYSGAQPPGLSQSTALVLDHSLSWGPASLSTGSRWDKQLAEAKGGTAYVMNRAGVPSRIEFSQASPSVALTLRALDDLSATVRRSRAFRPPLIDEYFTNNGYCNSDQALYELSGETGICGHLYRPDVADHTELTLAWTPKDKVLGGRLQARATFFRVTTRHVLESITAANGHAEQPGVEYRHGSELEASYDQATWFASLSVSRVDARQEDGGPNAPAVFDLPGSLTSATLGSRWLDNKIEAGLRWRSHGDRVTLSGTQVRPECGRLTGQVLPNQRRVAIQYGPDVLDLFASWRIQDSTMLRVSVDNVANEAYCTLSGFLGGIGLPAAGRSAKVSLSVQI